MIATVGVCSYNGITFDAYFATLMKARPISDTAGRTVKLVEYTFSIKGFVSSSTAGWSDGQITTLRASLMRRAGPLIFAAHGYGTFIINDPTTSTGVWDAAHGPEPLSLTVRPIGGAGSQAGPPT